MPARLARLAMISARFTANNKATHDLLREAHRLLTEEHRIEVLMVDADYSDTDGSGGMFGCVGFLHEVLVGP